MMAYIRCLPKPKRPKKSVIIRKPSNPATVLLNVLSTSLTLSLGSIVKVIDVAFLLLTSNSRRMRYEHYSCDLRKAQVAM